MVYNGLIVVSARFASACLLCLWILLVLLTVFWLGLGGQDVMDSMYGRNDPQPTGKAWWQPAHRRNAMSCTGALQQCDWFTVLYLASSWSTAYMAGMHPRSGRCVCVV
jgi:hypothetical protein